MPAAERTGGWLGQELGGEAAEDACEQTCLCRSVGRGGKWPFLSRNWPPSTLLVELRVPVEMNDMEILLPAQGIGHGLERGAGIFDRQDSDAFQFHPSSPQGTSILDGVIVRLGDDGKPIFLRRDVPTVAQSAVDLLDSTGHDHRDLPLRERKALCSLDLA